MNEEEWPLMQRIRNGLCVQLVVSVLILLLVAGALVLGLFFWDRFAIKPFVGTQNVITLGSPFYLDMGQSVAQRLVNTQLFCESYQLVVTPESMIEELQNAKGLHIGLYDNTKAGSVVLEQNPSVYVKEHWVLGSLNTPPLTLLGEGEFKYEEKRIVSLNPGSSLTLEYSYRFDNVETSQVNVSVSDYPQFVPQCIFVADNAANCTLQIHFLQYRSKLGPFEPAELPLTFNFTLDFVYEYVLSSGDQAQFEGHAQSTIFNTVFSPTGSSAFQACNLQTLECPVTILGGLKTMTFVASQERNPETNSLVSASANPSVQLSLKPKIRYWLYLTCIITPPAVLFLLFCFFEYCIFCFIYCRPFVSQRNVYQEAIDEEKLRLVTERRQALYKE